MYNLVRINEEAGKTDFRENSKIEYIVVHYTAEPSSKEGAALKIAQKLMNNDIAASADFFVDDKTVVQFNPDPVKNYSWHCGEPKKREGGELNGICTNLNSIGIEICSVNESGRITHPGDPRYYFTEETLNNAAELIKKLMTEYHIDMGRVIRHYDVTGKKCPGVQGWYGPRENAHEWIKFRELLQPDIAPDFTVTGKEIADVLSENGIPYTAAGEFADTEFSSVCCNSKKAENGGLLFIKGAGFREEYLKEAISRGISGYISEKPYSADVPCLIVPDVLCAMGFITGFFYRFPQKELFTAGITGTNGKTTTAHFLAKILEEESGKRCALISTAGSYDGKDEKETKLTTPESLDTYAFMRRAANNGCTHFIMECSSQGEKKKRLTGMTYDIGIFTNISDDHYSPLEHSSFEEYLAAKTGIVRRFKNAVINLDDQHACDMIRAAQNAERTVTYSVDPEKGADVYAKEIKKKGLRPVFTAVTPSYTIDIEVPMPGIFNISNALAAIAAAYIMGISPEKIAAGIKETFVRGRMFVYDINGYIAVIDYAHNYAALKAALTEVKELYPKKNISVITGSAGKNGLQRRKDIIRAAAPICKKIYLTTEDPNGEDTGAILKEMVRYAKEAGLPYRKITDRTECIKKAVHEMSPQDVLFIAAKGNEHFIKDAGESRYYEGDPACVSRFINKKRIEDLSHSSFLTWKTYDPYYNEKEMWPLGEYPKAGFRYIFQGGCFVVSLAVMMRLFGIEKETSFEKFNPLILCDKIKSVGGFDEEGCVDMDKLPLLYPFYIKDTIPYNKDDLENSLKEGYACQIIVKGVNYFQHYVVPLEVTEDDVKIIDPTWNRIYISECEPVWIARYVITGKE